MTDRDWMHDPEHELENAVLADELRTLLHAAPAAGIDPAIRAAEIRDVIQHAWPAARRRITAVTGTALIRPAAASMSRRPIRQAMTWPVLQPASSAVRPHQAIMTRKPGR